ncbi:hypothetical protein [Neisseria wadsworthii]|nr:hypothetical protein [Neisseria wadsworthii]QMT36054.1 hypothetical protein H3L96_02015 [Neisseria wadsworthii]
MSLTNHTRNSNHQNDSLSSQAAVAAAHNVENQPRFSAPVAGSADTFSSTNVQKLSAGAESGNAKPTAEKIEALKTYIEQNQDWAAKNILAAYDNDSDGDGLIDRVDGNPNDWNVSDRDLRMLASLTEVEQDSLHAALNQQSEEAINDINTHKLMEQADVRELSENWDLLKQEQTESGLDYAIFGNHATEDGYRNVVVAFEGTEADKGIFGGIFNRDNLSNISLFTGITPSQAKDLELVAQDVAAFNPNKVHVAGYSLGGYLAQYFSAHTMQSKPEWAEDFVRSALFNPGALNNTNLLTRWLPQNKGLNEAVNNTREYLKTEILDNGDVHQKTKSFVIEGDWVDWINKHVMRNLVESSAYKPTNYFPNVPVDENSGREFSDLFLKIYKIFSDEKAPKIFNDHHLLKNFYSNTPELQAQFSQGYRVDKHFQDLDDDNDGLTNVQERHIGTAVDNADSDGDGYSDFIEAAFGANALNKDSLPEEIGNTQGNAEAKARQTEFSDLAVNKIGGVSLKGTDADEVFSGSDGEDVLQGGPGIDKLTGGAGRDTFVFAAGDVGEGQADVLTDFNAEEDVLDLGGLRPLFEDRSGDFQWSDVLVSSTDVLDNSQSETFAKIPQIP